MYHTLSSFAATLSRLLRSGREEACRLRADDPFNDLALALFRLQHQANPDYRQWCQSRGVDVEAIRRWQDIPAVPTSAFKQSAFSCLAPGERTTFFQSSGTTASARSRHLHSAESLALYEAALRPWFRVHLLGSGASQPRRFLSLTPSRDEAPHSSLVHMLECVAREEPFEATLFAGERNADGAWAINPQRARDFLQAAIRDQAPVLLTGTAFNFVHWLDHLEAVGIVLPLPAGSAIMETGGYKGRSRSLSKAELHDGLARTLGLPTARIVTEYGMTELSSQAYNRVAGGPDDARHLRFPPWTRAMVISPETGREAGLNEVGLMRIWDLANAFSVLAIETEDLGRRDAQGVHLIGRNPLIEPRGCSLRSEDLPTNHPATLATAHAR